MGNIDGININEKIFSGKLKFDSQVPSIENEVACFKKVLKEKQTDKIEEPPVLKYAVPSQRTREMMVKYAVPDYYLPNFKKNENIEKYALPSEEIVKPMYAVPPVEQIKTKDENEPPVLKYAIPE